MTLKRLIGVLFLQVLVLAVIGFSPSFGQITNPEPDPPLDPEPGTCYWDGELQNCPMACLKDCGPTCECPTFVTRASVFDRWNMGVVFPDSRVTIVEAYEPPFLGEKLRKLGRQRVSLLWTSNIPMICPDSATGCEDELSPACNLADHGDCEEGTGTRTIDEGGDVVCGCDCERHGAQAFKICSPPATIIDEPEPVGNRPVPSLNEPGVIQDMQ